MNKEHLLKIRILSALLVAGSLALTGCGGGNTAAGAVGDKASPTPSPRTAATIAVPNAKTPPFSFDIGAVEAGKYYVTDRNNKSVDVVDTKTNKLEAQITGGFAGTGKTFDTSGPDGIVTIPGAGTIYVGDVNSVKVIDTATQKVTKNIPVSTNGFRADEGCYDPDDNLIMIASPGESPPFVTFISTKTQTIVGHLDFKDSTGLEDCKYNAKSKTFNINNDGTPANPHGQIDVITASSVTAGAPAVTKSAPLGDCNPTGMVLGPNNEMLIGCDPPAGKDLTSLILDGTSLATIAKVPFAGEDQVDYDPTSNKYFLAGRHWVPGGVASTTGQVSSLGVVDGATHALSYTLPAGANAHSVAVDSASGQIYLPFAPGIPAFPDGGIQVVGTR